MKGKFIFLGVAALMTIVSGASLGKTSKVVSEERDAKILVELKYSFGKKERDVLNEQNLLISRIRQEVTSNVEVTDRFVNVANAFAMKVNAKYVTQIRNIPGVVDVNYDNTNFVQTTEADLAKKEALVVDKAFKNISKETMNVPDGTKEGEGTLIAILDTGFMINASYTDDNEVEYENVSHAAYTALDDDVALKYTQEQIKAKIDASAGFHGKYDETHSTYFNNKVPFYYDYGGDLTATADENPDRRDAEPDYDVFDQYNDHGNHVATIAAGNDPYYKGIAPKAQLALMKVFTPVIRNSGDTVTASSGATDGAIMAAFDDCIALGVDVVNMSLGSTLNDFTESSIVLNSVKRLQNAGTLCAIAAGNDGKDMFNTTGYEYWTRDMAETGILGGYASSDATIIASAQPDEKYYETALKVGENVVAFKDQAYTRGSIEVVEDHMFVDLLKDPDHADGNFEWIKIPGLGEASDYATLVTKEENKVKGKIAIIDRGEIPFTEKVSNAQNNGAIAVGIIDNDPSQTDFTFNMDFGGFSPSVPVVSFLNRDKGIFDNADDFTCVLFNDKIEMNPTGRQLADSSSDGPVYDLSIKPEIATPGDGVFGGIYAEGPHSYEYYSGTSMATPNYAGVYALMLSEHLGDEAWKASLTDKLMSTAEPMKDRFNKNFEAVRKQGAGLVNVSAALSTDVYLDGSKDANNLLGKAKVELKNNDSIKNGIVDLSFTTINEGVDAVNYNASLYVYRPALGSVDSERVGEKFEGVELMSNLVELVTPDKKPVESTLNVLPGKNVVNFHYELDADAKAFIDEKFPYGTYLEGFVVLSSDGKEDISIPYLGFYGNYGSGIPVEPFKFERNNDLVYPSDLLNHVGKTYAQKNGVDYGSDWVIGNWDNMSALSLEDYIANGKKLRDYVDFNGRSVTPACTNPYTGEYETKDIYMGNNGFSNTMIIQQFVMRSVYTNTLTITNKATNEVVLVDHMFDSLFGAVEDENGNDIQWPLYKSFVDMSYWSAGYLAHRAYTIIPLYEYEYDEETEKYTIGDEFPEGEYEIKFNYEIAAGGTYEKKYTLHIDNSVPTVKSVTPFSKDGKDYLRIRYDEIMMSYVAINGYKFQIEKDEKGFYVDIEKDKYSAKNKVFLRGYDFASGYSNVLIKVNDVHNVSVSSASLTNAFDFQDGFESISDNSFSLQFSFTKSNKATTLNEDLNVSINMSTFDNCDLSKDMSVVAIDKNNKQSTLVASYDLGSGTLSFVINSQDKVVITYGVKDVVPPDPGSSSSEVPSSSVAPSSEVPSSSEAPSSSVAPSSEVPSESSSSASSASSDSSKPSKDGCGGSILSATSLVAVLAVAGIGILFSKKKND